MTSILPDALPLTVREREVLGLIADGHTDASAAQAMGIGARGARFHVTNAVRKMHARTRTQAVALAIRSGLLPERQSA